MSRWLPSIEPLLIGLLLSLPPVPWLSVPVGVITFAAGGIVRVVDMDPRNRRAFEIGGSILSALPVIFAAISGVDRWWDSLANGAMLGLLVARTDWELGRPKHAYAGVVWGFVLTMARDDAVAYVTVWTVAVVWASLGVAATPVGAALSDGWKSAPFAVATLIPFIPAVRTGYWPAAVVMAMVTTVVFLLASCIQHPLRKDALCFASPVAIFVAQAAWVAIGVVRLDQRELLQLIPACAFFLLANVRRDAERETARAVSARLTTLETPPTGGTATNAEEKTAEETTGHDSDSTVVPSLTVTPSTAATTVIRRLEDVPTDSSPASKSVTFINCGALLLIASLTSGAMVPAMVLDL